MMEHRIQCCQSYNYMSSLLFRVPRILHFTIRRLTRERELLINGKQQKGESGKVKFCIDGDTTHWIIDTSINGNLNKLNWLDHNRNLELATAAHNRKFTQADNRISMIYCHDDQVTNWTSGEQLLATNSQLHPRQANKHHWTLQTPQSRKLILKRRRR